MPIVSNQAANLSYNKSLSPTYGQMMTASTADPNRLRPLPVVHLQGRGGVSNYLSGVETGDYKNGKAEKAEQKPGDEEKKAQTPDQPNLYEGDTCFMPLEDDLLIVRFNLLVEGQTKKPLVCNNPELGKRLEDIAVSYAERGGYRELARRYLWNMLNGRPLWRNFTRSFGVQVEITDLADKTVIQHGEPLSLSKCELPKSPKIDAFVEKMAKALSGETAPMRIAVKMTATMMPGCEVFPSQGFAENNDSGKLLAKDGNGNALIHPQKIGAALRFVDDWYPDAKRTIAAEPYGFDQTELVCLRLNGKCAKPGVNLYQLLAKADTDVLLPLKKGGNIPGDIHYFMAVLARGGVFSNVKSAK